MLRRINTAILYDCFSCAKCGFFTPLHKNEVQQHGTRGVSERGEPARHEPGHASSQAPDIRGSVPVDGACNSPGNAGFATTGAMRLVPWYRLGGPEGCLHRIPICTSHGTGTLHQCFGIGAPLPGPCGRESDSRRAASIRSRSAICLSLSAAFSATLLRGYCSMTCR